MMYLFKSVSGAIRGLKNFKKFDEGWSSIKLITYF